MNKLVVFLLFVLCSVNSNTILSNHSFSGGEKKKSCLQYIPKAISPNGDGINDLFVVESPCNLPEFTLKIFNEKAQLLHESKNIHKGWDGFSNGKPVPEGYYNYTISYQESGNQVRLEGQFVLVR